MPGSCTSFLKAFPNIVRLDVNMSQSNFYYLKIFDYCKNIRYMSLATSGDQTSASYDLKFEGLKEFIDNLTLMPLLTFFTYINLEMIFTIGVR